MISTAGPSVWCCSDGARRSVAAVASSACPWSEKRCLAVLIPVYNEAMTLDRLLERVLAQPWVQEVIGVDDGSHDGSWDSLQMWAKRDRRLRALRHEKNRGKGAAIRTALAHASAPTVVIQDADLEYDPEDYERLLAPIWQGQAEVVYGTRFAPRAHGEAGPWHVASNRLLTWLANQLTGLELTDEATCYKLFRREVLANLTLEEQGFGFCPEVTVKLSKLGVRIVEVPISYHSRSRAGGKKIRLRDGFGAAWCLIKYASRA